MHNTDTWANTFFSGDPPEFITEADDSPKLREFRPEDDRWRLGQVVDRTRLADATRIQVFWLRHEGRRKYVAKVFPDYTPEQAAEQLRRLRVPESRIGFQIEHALYEFDRFSREARAYSHIERFCPIEERIYFPRFHGTLTNMDRSRFSAGYAHPRALVLEAIKPDLRSRQHSRNLPLSPLELEWYCSLLCDRLRRLAALHRIGVTHGDLRDHHFRLPGDNYDTVLFDFSEAYTFTPHWPYRVNSGIPRPLKKISEGERRQVELHIQQRAEDRDLRSYLVKSISECMVDDALCQPLEKELLEVIIFRVWTRPDYFSMPSLSSAFPFLEAIRPADDPTWHIRRGRILNCYESVWASFIPAGDPPASVMFHGEPGFENLGLKYLLCLVPRAWDIGTSASSDPKHAKIYDKLRQACSLLISSKIIGCIIHGQEIVEQASRKFDC
ncbi:hypothetical protein ASPZODRAFT_153945 [Penicilliopsis zonata CBS 506.65]|uniref:Protein kinase domain-containing protein n=1 Tax=Penicilliopsis zonata CBS 506.65 TaxID=1073090 RepID=A0A1L9S9U1_9EURO|nr:hypothetical protein ASPZODRAFT_153945 [Penicilliopsis zonata CBS 506.65]OJJ43962.1 hypothetical protein ASPZODRAFT_153945 [Penicilliopsis zonata CBS 506.65]